ncbi:MAG: PSD1 and planctomycete cytochrome C domain-containing protein [Pirellulaceae bacterium]
MKCIKRSQLLLASIAVLAATGAAEATDTITQADREFFEEKIRPVLMKQCYECHSHDAGSLSADYALDSREGIRAGGATGEPAIVPTDPDSSPLLQALRYEDLQMPPEEPLPDPVIADFERWIAMGAPDPRVDDPKELRRLADAKSAEKLWSFQPPVKGDVPRVENADWPHTAIDHFVLKRLEGEGLRPIADADSGKLIRRVYFDLIGLPPSPEEVEQFATDPTPESFAAIVDRLLSSPRFGERWGRHWLDLARYAESSGMEFNFTYPHAWPYRDYVIDSFNKDKPYDRFITEQLAGDLLRSSSAEQRDENRLATGFLAVGPKRHNAGTSTFRMEMVDDQIKATTEAFLGLTVGCARCHDHKFDPVPEEDYYALAGIFLSTEALYGTTKIKYSRHPTEKIPFGEDAEERHAEYQAHQKNLKEAEKELSDKKEQLKKLKAKDKEDDKDDTEKSEDEEKKTEETKKDRAKKKKQLEAETKALEEKVKQLKADTPEPPKYAMGATEGKPANTYVAIGGDPGNKGDTVPRGFLSAVPVSDIPSIDDQSSGRLELAQWITSPGNPLTARVMVNRVWHHLFGRGLVPTVNNFGVLGEKPSHPELLDYLAVRFVENDWSTKQLIRAVVLSRVYQLSTRKDADNFQEDPDNVLLWRMTPRRLEVEPLRDALLAVSGQLDAARPEGSTVTPLGQQLARAVAYEKLNPASNHRTVYLPVVRHYTPHMLQEFDFAASSLVVGDRAETTTSQQALFFLNNDFILEQAEATARLLMKEASDPAVQIRTAYQRTLSRSPTPAELATAREYLQRAAEHLKDEYSEADQRQTMALSSFMQTLFGSAEFRYLIHSPESNGSGELAAATRAAAY